jgi:hypothetical protein
MAGLWVVMLGLAWDAYIVYNFPQGVGSQFSLSCIGCEQQEGGTSANRRHNPQSNKNNGAAPNLVGHFPK